MSGTHNVRVRGIYATALTRLFLEVGHDVVDASPPIRRRFDAEFETGVPDADVWTTDDRQGIGVGGVQEAVESIREQLTDVGRDALAWTDPAPRGAVFDGEVAEMLGGGAVVDLGIEPIGERTVEGYLPYGSVDNRVETSDRLRVQVREPAPPWESHRHELGTELRAVGELVSFEPGSGTRVESYDDAAGRELAGMADLLGLDAPDGWKIVWHRPAVDADMGSLERGLERAIDRAAAIETAVDDAGAADDTGATSEAIGEPGPVVRPSAGAWVWFGRESRFALDDRRRTVETTMPGHHRVKAGSEAASAGVDLAEALCEFGGTEDANREFPFTTVCDVFGPEEGEEIRIDHGKPDGRLITLGTGVVTERDADGTVAVRRELSPGGEYDALGVPKESGDTALTKLKEGRWWYPTVYRDAEGTPKGTYVNVCTPVEVFPDTVRYVDLHVDVVKHRDGTVERVDDEELDAAIEAGYVPPTLGEKARDVATALENAL